MPDPKPLDRDGDGGAARNMSLRDWFAGQVLMGLSGGSTWPRIEDGPEMARRAYAIADAMVKEGAK